jgi:hypothetical protein
MKSTLTSVLTIVAALVSHGAARAQITTVILANDDQVKFTVSAGDTPAPAVELKFTVAPPFPGATVTKWLLRVVPTKSEGERAAQDVAVLSDIQQVGQWSAFSRSTEPFATELKPGGFKPGTGNVLTLGLKTESKLTAWDYHGGKATNVADRPRLIVTYDSASSPKPTSGRSGHSTDWSYAEPSLHFSSTLWSGKNPLANPVSYAGAIYVLDSSEAGRSLNRVTGAQAVTNWVIPNKSNGEPFAVTGNSFAFATAWGQFQLITKNAIGSCNLRTVGSPGTAAAFSVMEGRVGVKDGETASMGPDGSLYFKNVEADGRIVAYNPTLKEIWETELKFTTVSPITLNENGRYAYALAEILLNEAPGSFLVRIDTATGEAVPEEIKYKDANNNDVRPLLKELLRPAVASKGNVEYVFVAGNSNDTGILQLMYFRPRDKRPTVLWSRQGKIATAPVLSIVDGNSLFVVQDGHLKHYPWYGSGGAYQDSAVKEQVVGDVLDPRRAPRVLNGAAALLVDGAGSLYVEETKVPTQDKERFDVFLSVFDRARGWGYSGGQRLPSIANLLFRNDGALIGYDSRNLYDLSARSKDDAKTVDTLANKTIYSAVSVTVRPDAAKQLKDGDQVIVKGRDVQLSKGFRWPVGRMLRVQTVLQKP